MKKFWIILFLFAISSPVFGAKIGILSNEKIPVYAEIVANFKKAMIPEGHTVKDIAVLNDDKATIRNIKDSGCQYFFSVGAPASKACNDSGFPGVFTMVVDPVKNGLIQKDGSPKGLMTGVLVDVSPRIQFSYLKKIMQGKNRIGILFDPGVSNFVVTQYLKCADEFGVRILDIPVLSKEEVPPSVESLKGKVDYILSVVDNTVYNVQSIQVILRFSITNKVPLIGFSAPQVKAGAMLAFYCHYPSLGTQAAKLMTSIAGGGDVKNMLVELPEETDYAVNMRSAAIMKIDISDSFKSGAAEVFGE